jgi:hypothetical protein
MKSQWPPFGWCAVGANHNRTMQIVTPRTQTAARHTGKARAADRGTVSA